MSSVVLTFDTATEHVAIALGERVGDSVVEIASHDFAAPRAANERLLPAIDALLSGCGLAPTDIEEIVVGRGPGSFTGVRIGVATAKGMAQGLGVPLYGVGTLDAVAWNLVGAHVGIVGVVGDAMRGEVYPALFSISDTAERLTRDHVSKPDVAAREWSDGERVPVLLTGDGLRRHAESFRAAMPEVAFADGKSWAPSGRSLLDAYAHARRCGEAGPGEPGLLLPVYTRLSDAEENEQARQAAHAAAADTPPSSGVAGPGCVG